LIADIEAIMAASAARMEALTASAVKELVALFREHHERYVASLADTVRKLGSLPPPPPGKPN